MTVKARDGVPIYRKDIATVQIGGDFRRGALDVNGHEVVGVDLDPLKLDLIRKGWLNVEVEQPLYAQAAALAMFADKVVNKQEIKPGNYSVLGLDSVMTIEKWGPNIKIPGAAITKENVDEARFWGNLKAPADKITPVQ